MVNFQYYYQNVIGVYCKVASLIKMLFSVQETLRALWYAAFPNSDLDGLISDQWKDMGWQGSDPSTDFRSFLQTLFFLHPCFRIALLDYVMPYFLVFQHRGGGYLSLENLLFFAKRYPVRCFTFMLACLHFYQHVACVFSLFSNFSHKFLLGI